jgi:tetratricopeptide (TPR) repeat protein
MGICLNGEAKAQGNKKHGIEIANSNGSEVVRKMAKKSKQSKHKKIVTTSPSRADNLYSFIERQIVQGDYMGAIANCERLLNYLPPQAQLRADVLFRLGVAYGMIQDYPRSYEVLTEVLALEPNNADIWYNRSMSSRFTSRFGRALQDIERAVELNTRAELAEQLDEALKFSRELAEQSIKLRGPDFTVDQLIEQEDLFQQGMKSMQAGKWNEAEQAFQASIAMGDCLPQPWGNLGICLLMQERYDEAETALNRALAIDPTYSIAKNNLALLAESRRTGPPKIMGISDPFRNMKMKQSLTVIKE